MIKLRTLLKLLPIAMLCACSGGRVVQMAGESESAYRAGDYDRALKNAEQIIDELNRKHKTAQAGVYAVAGKSAWELGQYGKSLSYLEQAQKLGQNDEMSLVMLAGNYRRTDNLSKEIDALTECLRVHPDGTRADSLRSRLLATCAESENYELADRLWMQMDPGQRQSLEAMEAYLEINRARDNESLSDSLAGSILDRDPDNAAALRHFAEKYFWKAENRYQAEMKAYADHRTTSQYKKLLEAFKTVTADFKESLSCFKKLYSIDPDPEIANYLGNIYTRLDDEQTAKYYFNRAK